MLRRTCLSMIALVIILFSLCACHLPPPGWYWESRDGHGDSMQLRRDHDDCFNYIMLTDDHYGGTGDAPGIVTIFDWDEPMVACMAKRGWIYVDASPDRPRSR